jgi:hypothetical protein
VVVLAQDEARELTYDFGFTDPAAEAARDAPALHETDEGRH